MKFESSPESEPRPLAGNCAHVWHDREGQCLIEQVCKICRLYRYKSSLTADWKYRAPIPFASRVQE